MKCYLTGRKWYTGKDSPVWKGGKKKAFCEQCSKEFSYRRAYGGKARFCSSKCWGEWWSKQHKDLPKRKKKSNPVRGNKEYGKWRREVIAKYGKCVLCGETKNLIAHHLISVKDDLAKTYEVENGIAVCLSCHHKIHYSK